MLSVGEGTGSLSDAFLFLADVYEVEVEEMTKNLTSLLEPVLLVFMGGLVGFVAVSVITPIYNITQNIRLQ
jgi:type IV pilus assembly protein PilC